MWKKEILIFLTFLIVFSFYAQWNDAWDFSQYLSLTRSIVERNAFDIDPYVNSTPYQYNVEGNYYTYIYVGHSFISTPVYGSSNFLNKLFHAEAANKTDKIYYERESFIPMFYETSEQLEFSRFFVLVSMVSLTGALTVLLFYKILYFFHNKKRNILLLTLSLGLGTSVFLYSTTFYPYVPAMFMSFFSFYIIIKRGGESSRKIYYFLSGIISGVAFGVYDLSFIPLSLLFVYCLYDERKKGLLFFIGSFIGFIPVLMYHYFILRSFLFIPRPLSTIYRVLTGSHFTGGTQGIILQRGIHGIRELSFFPHMISRILFYPYRGLFFYYPFLILFFPGLYFMVKNGFKKQAFFILSMFLILLLTATIRWWGDFAFGPRRLIMVLPFMCIPIIYCFKAIDDYKYKRIFKAIIISLILVSIFVNFLGLQVWEGTPDLEPTEETMRSWKPLGDPLRDRYLPLFFENGPRSILFENLILESKINIFNSPQICKSFDYISRTEIPLLNTRSGILTLRMPFLSLAVVLIILLFLWGNEVYHYFNLSKMTLLIIILVIILLFIISFLRVRTVLFDNGWDRNVLNGESSIDLDAPRAMTQNGSLLIHSPEAQEKKIRFEIKSINDKDDITVLINGERKGTYPISKEFERINESVKLDEGVNEILFNSKEGCYRNTSKCDIHCTSFIFNKVGLVNYD